MGRYTTYEEAWIDEQIESQLRVVTDIILRNISNVQTIILAGSFGRGEGSVIIRDGQVSPLRDYDIILILRRKIPSWRLNQLVEEVNRYLSHKSSSKVNVKTGFSVSITQFDLNELVHFRDIKTFDIKTGSIILYGEDIRNSIKFNQVDIPPLSSARILFHKMMGLAQTFSPNFWDNEPNEFRKLNLILECGKTYLDIGSVLTLMIEKYKPTYLEKCKIIDENRTNFHYLAEKIPDLNEKIKFFTDFKLSPNQRKINQLNAIELWFNARWDLRVVFEYYMSHRFGVPTTSNLIEFCEKCYDHIVSDGIDPYVSFHIGTKVNVNKPLIKFISYLSRRYFTLQFIKGANEMKQPFCLSVLKEFPMFRIYCSIPLLLYSLNKNGELNETLFSSFTKTINKLIPFQVKSSSINGRWTESINCLKRLKRIMYVSFE